MTYAAETFARAEALAVLEKMLKKYCMEPLPDPNAMISSGKSVVDVADKFFPQLALLARGIQRRTGRPGYVPGHMRPLLAVMGTKALDLWSTEGSHRLFCLPTDHDTVGFSRNLDGRTTFTLRNVYDAAKREPPAPGAMDLLKQLMECYERVPTTRAGNALRGLVTAPSLSFDFKRRSLHTGDVFNNTNAYKMLTKDLG